MYNNTQTNHSLLYFSLLNTSLILAEKAEIVGRLSKVFILGHLITAQLLEYLWWYTTESYSSEKKIQNIHKETTEETTK